MLDAKILDVQGFEQAIKGMRNSRNSWSRMDSIDNVVGPNDLKLMHRLFKSGTEHRKYARMITVWIDINAPLYWWKEFDQYKIGTVSNSCSTMYTLMNKPFELKDFSVDKLNKYSVYAEIVIDDLNELRERCLNVPDPKIKKDLWYSIVQLLPESYNQTRTIMMNYEVVARIIQQRKGHKLEEWKQLIDVLKGLPYINEIMGEGKWKLMKMKL